VFHFGGVVDGYQCPVRGEEGDAAACAWVDACNHSVDTFSGIIPQQRERDQPGQFLRDSAAILKIDLTDVFLGLRCRGKGSIRVSLVVSFLRVIFSKIFLFVLYKGALQVFFSLQILEKVLENPMGNSERFLPIFRP
jgi:hypothetical protein